MIHGIGVDIVKVERMRAGLQRFGHRFTRRILTDKEHAEFESRRCPPRFLASRFAAKEAFSKALGTGLRDGLTLRTLSVSNDSMGRPLLSCAGRAAQIIEDLAIGSIHLSLSDEIDFAVAFVVLETRDSPVNTA
ncbi:MAG: holo-ACP synthase [Gammaproteobacteria bacterium]